MPQVPCPPDKALRSFLKNENLDQFAQEIVEATGLCQLKDLLENVQEEDDLSDLQTTSMKKLQIRKLFRKLVERRQEKDQDQDLAGQSQLREKHYNEAAPTQPPRSSSIPCRRSSRISDRAHSLPAAARRTSSVSSLETWASSTTGISFERKCSRGHQFEMHVRDVLRSQRKIGLREDVDFRDSVGLETDYVEQLHQTISAEELLPTTPTMQFMTHDQQEEVGPGFVLYEMKLTLAEPQIGKAVGQLRLRSSKLQGPGQRHLVVVGTMGTELDFVDLCKSYPGIRFYVATWRADGLSCDGKALSLPRAVGQDHPDHVDVVPAPPVRIRSRSASLARKRLTWEPQLQPVLPEGSSDETDTDQKLGPRKSSLEASSTQKVDLTALPIVEAGRNEVQQEDPHEQASDSNKAEVALRQVVNTDAGTGSAPRICNDISEGGSGRSLIHENLEAESSNESLKEPTTDYRAALNSNIGKTRPPKLSQAELVPSEPQTRKTGRGRSRERRASKHNKQNLEEYAKKYKLDNEVLRDLTSLPLQLQSELVGTPLDKMDNPSAALTAMIKYKTRKQLKPKSGQPDGPDNESADEVTRFIDECELDDRAAKVLKCCTPEQQHKVISRGLPGLCVNPSAIVMKRIQEACARKA
eukprot:TRINITY_DN109428_c0_g1_i1.p1 TRINITY_DN109428_c0_g1~~TRINITY_DN109428_c0_g1_i1.p1  ORF type:complete len:640 (-),score=123.74 TRINITY_DN109428_c0_g1_i1:479-2398(-)